MRVYLSHSIRGKKGNAATNAEMKECCDAAIAVGEQIRTAIPSLDLYIPGEHEEFVQIAFKKKYITEKHILDVDCTIIDGCDIVIVYVPSDDELQGGRKIEYDHATRTCKPVFVFSELGVEDVVEYLVSYILRG